jgi:hypothetical protein
MLPRLSIAEEEQRNEYEESRSDKTYDPFSSEILKCS